LPYEIEVTRVEQDDRDSEKVRITQVLKETHSGDVVQTKCISISQAELDEAKETLEEFSDRMAQKWVHPFIASHKTLVANKSELEGKVVKVIEV
tara:strand:- start:6 stop:287 length:282 start_codon:yes stop_codon:yes gene_type:complete